MHTARNADRQRLIETESNFHLSSLFFNPVILIFFLSQLSQSLQRSGCNADRFYLIETAARVYSHFSGILISSSLSISFWAMSVKLVLQWRQAMPGQGQQFSFSLLSDFSWITHNPSSHNLKSCFAKSSSDDIPKYCNFSIHSVFPSALPSLGPLTYSPGSLLFSSDGANVSFGGSSVVEGQPASVPVGSYPAPGFSNMRLVFSFMSLIRMTCLSKEREAHSNSRPWQDFVKTCWWLLNCLRMSWVSLRFSLHVTNLCWVTRYTRKCYIGRRLPDLISFSPIPHILKRKKQLAKGQCVSGELQGNGPNKFSKPLQV